VVALDEDAKELQIRLFNCTPAAGSPRACGVEVEHRSKQAGTVRVTQGSSFGLLWDALMCSTFNIRSGLGTLLPTSFRKTISGKQSLFEPTESFVQFSFIICV
jgi:hypothetical protein